MPKDDRSFNIARDAIITGICIDHLFLIYYL